MRALVRDRYTTSGFGVAEVPRPVAGPDEVVVRVEAFSMNFGEVRDGLDHAPNGAVLGWEAAGTVVQAAADGAGPPVGAPVVTFNLDGGWAEFRAAPHRWTAPVAPNTDLGAASTVVVAGTTALRALRRIGDIRGERVLVTGATGGVGRFAIQLARLGGAHPVAVTRTSDSYTEQLRALGAQEIYPTAAAAPDGLRGVIDSVGGAELVAAFGKLTDHGTLVTVGQSAGASATLPYESLIGQLGKHDRSIATFFLLSTPDLPPDFTYLAALVADGTLDTGIAWRGDWHRVSGVTAALMDRSLHGKAVVDLT